MDRKAEAGQMLKANRGGAKDVGVTGQETYDAFALTGGGVSLSDHDRSRRLLRFGQSPSDEALDAGIGNAGGGPDFEGFKLAFFDKLPALC